MASSSSRSLARFAAPGVLLLASLALFGGGLLPGHAFFYRDVLHYYWPMQATHLRLGLVPQWDPFHAGGLPFLGNIHAGVLYPPNLLFALFSFPTAYALLLLVHHFVAQLGLFVFLRRKDLDEVPALIGALAFGLTGYVAGLCNAGPIMLGLAWMPWVLVALHARLLPVRKLALLSVLIAAQLLSGDPQSALYSALVALASVAWFPERKNPLVALAGSGALGLLLAGAQVLPTVYLLTESTRGGDAPSSLSALEWNLHPQDCPPDRDPAFSFPFYPRAPLPRPSGPSESSPLSVSYRDYPLEHSIMEFGDGLANPDNHRAIRMPPMMSHALSHGGADSEANAISTTSTPRRPGFSSISDPAENDMWRGRGPISRDPVTDVERVRRLDWGYIIRPT